MRIGSATPSASAVSAPPLDAPGTGVTDDLTVYTIDQLAPMLRISAWTIRRRVARGTFRPAPIDRRPFRWLKADIVAELERLRRVAEVDAAARERANSRKAAPRRRRKRTRTN